MSGTHAYSQGVNAMFNMWIHTQIPVYRTQWINSENQKQIECLKELRKYAGVNQREMSEELGIPLRTWEDWESVEEYLYEYVGENVEIIETAIANK